AGALFINQLKDIIITVLAASAVITGELTLGMMLAIQYIIGQLNAPLQQLIAFISSAQDAKISLERLEEIHAEPEELPEQNITPSVEELNGNIVIENISFRYNALYDWVLENLSLVIPKGKVTAIVGNSGSGKTTLLKLLLGFYNTEQGSIRVNNFHLNHLELDLWRRQCGAVMQDGFIFSDTIANNIAESDDQIDYIRLNNAIHIANIQGFLQKLPLGLNTMIGAQGNGLSQGQKQRLLIARAAYREPNFLFFDEATNSLDANNERTIIERLNEFFDGRTVVVVAHRLSTVKNADQIIVLDQGKVVEQGTHEELTTLRGAYYTLVKNQLELGN
ncbi:MAG: ATP-binding cassette domain-containing protein, partial [Bacteroidota bacterium]